MMPPINPMVGGTLIDGYSRLPIQNSLFNIEGDKVKAVGQVVEIVVSENA